MRVRGLAGAALGAGAALAAGAALVAGAALLLGDERRGPRAGPTAATTSREAERAWDVDLAAPAGAAPASSSPTAPTQRDDDEPAAPAHDPPPRDDAEAREQDLTRRLEAGEPDPRLLLERARARLELGHLDGAEADLGRALQLDPTLSVAYAMRARLRQVRGDIVGARVDPAPVAELGGPPEPLRVDGLVLDAQGRPVAGAVVIADGIRHADEGQEIERHEVRTDVAGRFAFDLPDRRGVRSLRASAPGHAPAQEEVYAATGGALSLTLTLREACGLRVVARTVDGRRVQGALVSAPAEGRTGPDGVALLADLAAGRTSVVVRAEGVGSATLDAVEVAPGPPREVEAVLLAAARVDIRVVPRTPHARVQLVRADGRTLELLCDETGTVEWEGEASGPVQVVAEVGPAGEPPTLIGATSGQARPGETLVLDVPLGAPCRLRGRLVGGVASLRQVYAEGPGGGRRAPLDEGRFDLSGLAPGQWSLELWEQGVRRRLATVTLAPGDDVVRDVALDDGATARGLVLDARDAPAADVRVIAATATALLTFAATGPDGRFELAPLPAGRVALLIKQPDGQVACVWVDLLPGRVSEGLELRLRPGGVARGRLLDPAGRPLAQVEVTLHGLDLTTVTRTATTDADGRFALGLLYDGRYALGLEPGPLAAALARLGLPGGRVEQVQLAVTDGATGEVTLRLAP